MTEQQPETFALAGPDGTLLSFKFYQPVPAISVEVFAAVQVQGPFTDLEHGRTWYMWKVAADGGRVHLMGAEPTLRDAWRATHTAAITAGLNPLADAAARQVAATDN